MTTEAKSAVLSNADYLAYLNKGIDYDKYVVNLAHDAITNPDAQRKEYISMNQHRIHRVEKTYHVGDEVKNVINALAQPIYWLVITEHWCGDAAQIVPVTQAIAAASEGKITMKLVYRDQNPELIEAYLTNNTKSIPKIVQLDAEYNVTGTWGPRPAVAQDLVKKLKANPETAVTYANELHLWYAKDKQQHIAAELIELLKKA
jgi:thioredoxin-like negative regulator of GroEL